MLIDTKCAVELGNALLEAAMDAESSDQNQVLLQTDEGAVFNAPAAKDGFDEGFPCVAVVLAK